MKLLATMTRDSESRWSDLGRSLALYLVTRGALALFIWLTGQHYDCHGPRCLDRAFFPENFLFNGLFQWDSFQYRQLIERGYYLGDGYDTTAPYFPAFSMLAFCMGKLVGSPLVGGIVVNHLASIAGAYLLARLVRRLKIGESAEAQPAVAREAVLFWLASPLTFFYCVFLTEALFAFASVALLWAVARGSWGLALVAGILASATRNAGLVVAACAVLLAWERRREVHVGVAGWVCLALTPAGLGGLMLWQHLTLGNALAWSETQLRWSRFLTTPWRTIADDWRGFANLHPAQRNVDAMYRMQELLALGVVAPLFALRRRVNIPWAILLLGLVEWILPLTSHSILSSARYQAGNVYFALAIPALLAPRPMLRGVTWMLFGMVLAWYASTYPFGVWAS